MVAFFVLALVGQVSDVTPWVVGLRAVAGGVVLYVVARLCGRLASHILADAMVRGQSDGRKVKGRDQS